MPYPESIVAPMRQQLLDAGFKSLATPEEVTAELQEKKGTKLLVFNSVCGCAAGAARPGVLSAISTSDKTPEKLLTVFAGQETDAVAMARQFTLPYPPSSPSIALFKDGELVHFVERFNIEGRSAEMISSSLKAAFEEYC